MKLIFAMLVTVCLQQGHAAYGQAITISKKNASISNVLKEIRSQTGYDFFFEDSSINGARKVDIHVKDASIEEVLASCFKDEPVSYTISGNAIVVRQKTAAPSADAVSTQRIINGTVANEQGDALAGVSVSVKGTAEGATTDSDGAFQIEVNPGDVLVLSYLGFTTQEVTVGNGQSIDIMMIEQVSDLDEVIVIGYGTDSKRNLISSVSTVDASQMRNIPTSSLTEGLGGRSPGLIVTKSGGGIGNKSAVSIRGGGTPLVVINGIIVPYADFQNLNSDDIESMSILKDASATAVYGARAGDGIIVVQTKTGQQGLAVNYSFNRNWSQPTYMARTTSSHTQALAANRVRALYDKPPQWTDEEVEKYRIGTDTSLYANTQWHELILRDFAPETKHSISLAGGSEANRFFASFQTYDQQSMYKENTNWLKRHNFRLSETSNFDKIGLRLNFAVDGYVESTRAPLSYYNRATGYGQTWGHIQNKGTRLPAFNRFGQPYLGHDHPYIEVSPESGYDKEQTTTITGQIGADWDVYGVQGLTFKAAGNYRINYFNQKRWEKTAPQYDLEGIPGPPLPTHLSYNANNYWRYTTQFFFDYERSFDGVHHVNATGGFENSYGFDTNLALGRRNYTFLIDQIGAGPSATMENSGSESEWGRAGFVGRLGYNYQNKYYFEGSLRHDGSDLFPKDKRWGTFYSGALGYTISEEAFFSPLVDKDIFNFLKLRVSYGQVGLDAGVGRFSYLTSYGLNERGHVIDGEFVPTFNEGALPSPDITWYTRNSSNIGLDFASLNNRLSGTVEYFYVMTKGYLTSPSNVDYSDPLGVGLPHVKSDGEHRRAGYELQLAWTDRVGDLHYEIGGNFTYFDQLVAVSWTEDLASQKNPYFREVQQTGYWGRGFVNQGYYVDANDVINHPRRDASVDIAAGDIKYQDFNGDGFIDNNDQVRIGKNGFPRGNYGIYANLSWKGVFTNILFHGSTSRNIELQGVNRRGGWVYDHLTDYWLPDNRNAQYPRMLTVDVTNGGNNDVVSDFSLIDGRFLRLKTLQVGYELKHTLLSRTNWLSSFQIILSGQNLLTFSPTTKFMLDPETGSTQNYDYPVQRAYSLSLNIGF